MVAKACRSSEIKIGDKCYPKHKIEKVLNIKAGYLTDDPIGEILLEMKKDNIVQLFELAQEAAAFE